MELISVISGFIVGLGGIIASIISTVLSLKRAKEANEIAKNSLLQTAYLQELKSANEKIIDNVCKFLQASAPQVLATDYETACAISDNPTGPTFSALVNDRIHTLSNLRNIIYFGMSNGHNEFYSQMLSTGTRFLEIYDDIKMLRLSVLHNLMELKINPQQIGSSDIEEISRQIVDFKLAKKIRDKIQEYNEEHQMLLYHAKQYVDTLKTDFLKEIRPSRDKRDEQNDET